MGRGLLKEIRTGNIMILSPSEKRSLFEIAAAMRSTANHCEHEMPGTAGNIDICDELREHAFKLQDFANTADDTAENLRADKAKWLEFTREIKNQIERLDFYLNKNEAGKC